MTPGKEIKQQSLQHLFQSQIHGLAKFKDRRIFSGMKTEMETDKLTAKVFLGWSAGWWDGSGISAPPQSVSDLLLQGTQPCPFSSLLRVLQRVNMSRVSPELQKFLLLSLQLHPKDSNTNF